MHDALQPGTMQIASAWSRLGAFIIDAVIFAIGISAAALIGTATFGDVDIYLDDLLADELPSSAILDRGYEDGDITSLRDVVEVVVDQFASEFGAGSFAFLFTIVYGVFYHALVAIRGQSPGKLAVGIEIVRTDGSDLGWASMSIREIVGKLIPSMIPVVNLIWIGAYLWIILNRRRQGWHDLIADTCVVRV